MVFEFINMMSLGELSVESRQEMMKYLKFFRTRKDSSLRGVDKEFEDLRMDRLTEDMYSKEDVEELLDFCLSSMRTIVGTDVSNIVNMGTLVVGQLLEDARRKGAELEVETSALENQKLLEAVEKMTFDSLPQKKKIDALPSFRQDAKRMEDSNRELEQQLRKLEDDSVKLSREKQELGRQISELKDRMSETLESSGKDGEENQERIRRLQDDLSEAKEENEKRVKETTQFQQMRKMMQTQSANIRDLRTRLAKYEPVDADAKSED